MLIITNKQMSELNRLYNERYEALTVIYLSAKYAEWASTQGPENIRVFVSDGVKRAERLRIVESPDVTAYLEYNVLLGPGFEKKEEHEWAAGILHIRNISGTEKVSRMLDTYPIQ